jgi:putative transposase
MVTAATWGRRDLLRNERWAKLLVDTLDHYRGKAYLLHEFAVMPDHVHVILTPLTSLEKAMQFIKGGFSYRAKKELGSNLEVWQAGFQDHRIRDASDYRLHAIYVRQNPLRKGLCEVVEQYEYSSASGRYELDGVPQGLKPSELGEPYGAAEAAPFQNSKPAISAESETYRGVQVGAQKIAPRPCQRMVSTRSEDKLAVNGQQPTTDNRRPCANDQRPRTND